MSVIDAETILYGTLKHKSMLTHNEDQVKVSINDIKQFAETVQVKMHDYYFDISHSSICAAIEMYPNVFRWDNGNISFVEHNDKLTVLWQKMFERRLPDKALRVFKNFI